MMYDYTPLSDEEISDILNFELKSGPARFKVVDWQDTISGNGNKMIKLVLKCTNTNEEHKDYNGIVKYNLVFSQGSQPFVASFFRSIGWIEAYKNKQWDSESLLNKEGNCIVVEESYTDRNGNQRIGLKVSNFLPMKDKLTGKPVHTGITKDAYAEFANLHSPEFDDKIPF